MNPMIYDLSNAKRSKMDLKYDPISLTLYGYDYDDYIKKHLLIQQ